MKKNFVFLFICCFCLANAFADVYTGPVEVSLKFFDNLTVNGPAKLKLLRTKTLDIQGPVEFHSIDVAGNATIIGNVKGYKGKFSLLQVTGSLEADEVICDDLDVKGQVTASSLIVKNQAKIEGSLTAQHSQFKTLVVNGDNITLNDVQADSLTVGKDVKKPVLVLQGATVINGDVIFESGDGLIRVKSPQAKIKGTVKGATTSRI